LKIPLSKPVLDDEMTEAAIAALQNEKFVMGESVFKFEEDFAKYCGVKHATSTSSGTFALQFALQALGIEQKTRVITTPYSFVATSNAALWAGATPVFADIDPKTYNINAELAKQELNNETKAIIPVHLYGFPADMQAISDLFDDHGCAVVEDACQAHGAEFRGRKTGSLGDVGCFSFYPSKNMTVCGDGGMATTNDEDVASKIAKLRDCGRKSHYEHDCIGMTARLNTVNAAIGRVQLKKLDMWNEKRRACARMYDHLLKDIEGLTLPPGESSVVKPVYHLYVIRTTLRDELKDRLESFGIQFGVHYPLPIHLQPIYRSLFGYKEGDFPESELVSKSVLSLPMFPDLEKEEVEYVCEKVHEFFDTRHET